MSAVTPSREALEPCPFCAKPLYVSRNKINPSARCMTDNCYGTRMSVVNLDDPEWVKSWNTRLAAKPVDEAANMFMPPDGDVTALGKEYLERRVSSMMESVDREQWRQEDGDAGRPEYWIGRLHEAKIALSNLTQGLERRGDSFGRPSTTGEPKP